MSHRARDWRLGRRTIASLGVAMLSAATAACDSTPYPTGEEFTTTVERGSDGAPGTPPPPAASPVVLDIAIVDGSVQPQNANLRAAVGQPIELRVDSDSVANIDVDGASDRTFAVKPVRDQVFDFSVDDPGTVTIATRQPAHTVATIDVVPQPPR